MEFVTGFGEDVDSRDIGRDLSSNVVISTEIGSLLRWCCTAVDIVPRLCQPD